MTNSDPNKLFDPMNWDGLDSNVRKGEEEVVRNARVRMGRVLGELDWGLKEEWERGGEDVEGGWGDEWRRVGRW